MEAKSKEALRGFAPFRARLKTRYWKMRGPAENGFHRAPDLNGELSVSTSLRYKTAWIKKTTPANAVGMDAGRLDFSGILYVQPIVPRSPHAQH
jgi:hypothetical protein